MSLGVQVAAALTSVYIIWGSTYLAIRFAIETLPPFLMASARHLIAGLLLYSWVRLRGTPGPTRQNWRAATIVGGLLLFGGNGGVVWAEADNRVPSGLAAVLVATVPLWIVLLEWLRHEGVRPTKGVIAGVALGFFGMILLVDPTDLAGGNNHLNTIGALVVILATFSWALGSLYSRGASLPKSSQLSTSMEMLTGGAILMIASLALQEWRALDIARVSLQSSLSFIYLIIFGSLVAFTAYIWLLRVATPAKVSTYAYVNPVVAVLLGWALAGEPVTLRTIVAAGIIITAVVVITTYRARKVESTGQTRAQAMEERALARR